MKLACSGMGRHWLCLDGNAVAWAALGCGWQQQVAHALFSFMGCRSAAEGALS